MIRKFVEARGARRRRGRAWGTGSPSREFLYVDDAARALLLAAERYDSSEPVNIGTGQETTHPRPRRDDRRGHGLSRARSSGTRAAPTASRRRCLDVSRAEREFGFEAEVPLDEGLRRTIEFFREQYTAAAR